ncbi:LLM class flavin-dependent oxidoreductase [Mycolicibacterium sp. S2-37]|uniref:LLM class flavin-dependent oxidoreductase n=1 Tax=Mycolicibacterium sp. S2-37 TaxID=2810297 RepID=UPI001A952152|nr:LLM class flavin-dependent oxidoreductase [Mycolicibacterium sp. S2-37]MBO0678265.1 LLM class flavin-dependent oxidoreductase [Mycolicibacterium sp. S2-37]
MSRPRTPDGTDARVGVVWRPDSDPGALASFAGHAEHAGVDDLWLWEDCFLQGGIAQAAVALAVTRSLVVGVGVLPAPLRSVVATALEISTLGTMFPGRVQVAIGHGVQDWMRQAGVAVASPLTLLREYVTALRELLAGRTVSVAGEYIRLDAVRLEYATDIPVPVLIGGAGPKTLMLAGEIADGVVLDCQHTPSSVSTALGHVRQGRAARAPQRFRQVMYLACAPGPGAGRRLSEEAHRWNLDPASEFGVGGSTEEINAGIAPYCAAGVDTLILQPVGEAVEQAQFPALITGVATAWGPLQATDPVAHTTSRRSSV